jgi:hypothetical protein
MMFWRIQRKIPLGVQRNSAGCGDTFFQTFENFSFLKNTKNFSDALWSSNLWHAHNKFYYYLFAQRLSEIINN